MTLTIDLRQPPRCLYRGHDRVPGGKCEYIALPYRLGLITATGLKAISELCRQ